MIIFLYGPDDYRRAQKKKEIIAEFKKKHSELGLVFFDFEGDAESLGRFDEFARSQPIFEKAKLAVLENAFSLDAKRLAKLLQPFVGEKSITLLLEEKSKPVKALDFLLEKPALAQKFEHPMGAELINFIKMEAKKLDLRLAEPAVQFLAAVYQGNSWGLMTELQKLSGLKKAEILKADLESLDLEAAPNYWALLNGMKSYDIRNRLFALETLFSLSDPAPKLFNILASQAGEKIPRMAEYDLAIKTGKMDYEEALLDLAIS